jgi:hypothetical protein
VIIFNEGNSEDRTGIEFRESSFPQDVPVIEMSAVAGAALVEFIEACRRQPPGQDDSDDDHMFEVRESENVIAQTTTGRTHDPP